MTMSLLKASCIYFVRLPNPFQESKNIKNYFAVVNVKDVFDFSEWRTLNVRDPKEHGIVPDAIRDSLRENELFFIMNRGITVTAESAQFDNQKNLLTLEFVDKQLHGLLDGGHTFLQIQHYLESLGQQPLSNQYIKIEIITGLDRDQVIDVVEARNTSNQVKQTSLEELRGTFNKLQDALKKERYSGLIAYKETEMMKGDDGGLVSKPISVLDILTCLICFDVDEFSDQKHPHNMATHKNAVLEHFAAYKDSGRRDAYYPLLPDMLRLWDATWKYFQECFNSTGGKFKKWNWVKEHPRKKKALHFLGGDVDYSFPESIRLPMFAAFRSAIEKRNGAFHWKEGFEPIEFFNKVAGPRLTKTVVDALGEAKDVTRMTRTESVWAMCYMAVENLLMKEAVGSSAR